MSAAATVGPPDGARDALGAPERQPDAVSAEDLTPIAAALPGDLLVEVLELRADVRDLAPSRRSGSTDRKGQMQARFLLFLLGFAVVNAFARFEAQVVFYFVAGAAGKSAFGVWGNVQEWRSKATKSDGGSAP